MLGLIGSLGERVDLLRRGDRGVLKVAAPPHTIESVLSSFLPRYADRFPNVHVKLSEALGGEQTAMLERGEVHIGIRHEQVPVAVSRASHCAGRGFGRVRPIAPAWPRRNDRYRPPRKLPVAAARFRFLYSEVVQRSLPSRRRRAQLLLESRAPHTLLALAEAGQGVAIIPSLLQTDRYTLRIVRVTHRRNPCGTDLLFSGTTGAQCRHMQGFLRRARRVHARGPPDHAGFGRQVGRRMEEGS